MEAKESGGEVLDMASSPHVLVEREWLLRLEARLWADFAPSPFSSCRLPPGLQK